MAAVLAAHWVLALSSALERSPAFDEPAHLTAGYSYWLTGDFRLNPENGLLPQLWAALPLLVDRPPFVPLSGPEWRGGSVWAVADQFLYHQGNDADALFMRARAMIALLSVALGLVVYGWARRLFGRVGGLVAVTLYAFHPSVLAHGSLVTSDVSLALFLTMAVRCLWDLLHRISLWTVLGSAVAIAGLVLSKMSGPLLLPMAALLVSAREMFDRPLTLALRRPQVVAGRGRRLAWLCAAGLVTAALAWTLVWAGYRFRYAAMAPRAQELARLRWAWLERERTFGTSLIRLASSHRLLPEGYLYGTAFVLRFADGRPAFLRGQYTLHGWWYFFPYCFLVKTPLPLFGILLLALLAHARWRGRREDRAGPRPLPHDRGAYGLLPLWVLLGVYWLAAVCAHLNVGERHMLATYPAMLVLAAASAARLRAGRRARGVWLIALMAWYLGESLAIRPRYLAYFNQLAGGPRHGYRHLVDSSLDWGQELPGLKRWLDRHGPSPHDSTPVYLSYFGSVNPTYYGIRAIPLSSPSEEFTNWHEPGLLALTGGVYCVSATALQALAGPVRGRWTTSHEQAYQALLARQARFARPSDDRSEAWLLLFQKLRAARLFAFLRHREPDDHVGFSILIYRLTDAMVSRALDGAPAELLPDPEGRSLAPVRALLDELDNP